MESLHAVEVRGLEKGDSLKPEVKQSKPLRSFPQDNKKKQRVSKQTSSEGKKQPVKSGGKVSKGAHESKPSREKGGRVMKAMKKDASKNRSSQKPAMKRPALRRSRSWQSLKRRMSCLQTLGGPHQEVRGGPFFEASLFLSCGSFTGAGWSPSSFVSSLICFSFEMQTRGGPHQYVRGGPWLVFVCDVSLCLCCGSFRVRGGLRPHMFLG